MLNDFQCFKSSLFSPKSECFAQHNMLPYNLLKGLVIEDLMLISVKLLTSKQVIRCPIDQYLDTNF